MVYGRPSLSTIVEVAWLDVYSDASKPLSKSVHRGPRPSQSRRWTTHNLEHVLHEWDNSRPVLLAAVDGHRKTLLLQKKLERVRRQRISQQYNTRKFRHRSATLGRGPAVGPRLGTRSRSSGNAWVFVALIDAAAQSSYFERGDSAARSTGGSKHVNDAR
jgi:hypothetical protein